MSIVVLSPGLARHGTSNPRYSLRMTSLLGTPNMAGGTQQRESLWGLFRLLRSKAPEAWRCENHVRTRKRTHMA